MFGFGKVTREKAAASLAAAMRSGDFATAARQYRKLAEREPDDPGVMNDLGFAMLECGELDASIAAFKAANRLRESDIHWNNLGRAFLAAGNGDEAKSAFRRARKLAPDNPQPWYNLTICLREAGDMDGSFRELQRLVAAHPAHAGARNDLALHCEDRGDRAAALDHVLRAVEADPDLFAARVNLVRQLCQAGRYPESVPHLEHLAGLGMQVRVAAEDGRVTITLDGQLIFDGPQAASSAG